MVQIINIVVGSLLLVILLMSIISCIVVHRKYKKMFATMQNVGRDKNLLLIEREYRHGYLKDKVARIRLFVEKEFYQIKMFKIPLYTYEDFSINCVYFSVLLGLTFTLIIIALSKQTISTMVIEVFWLSIQGLLSGMIIMIARNFAGIPASREIFMVNLCSYLEHELKLFNGVDKDDEVIQTHQKVEKNSENTVSQQEGVTGSSQHRDDGVLDLSVHQEEGEQGLEDSKEGFNERALLEVLEAIFN